MPPKDQPATQQTVSLQSVATAVTADSHRSEAPKPLTATLPLEGYLRLPKVLTVIPVCASGWWAGIQEGRYPPGVKLSPRVTAWSVESIRALVATINAQHKGDAS
jgi:predicted DNA-binding transcriptional regulator AlpA